MKCELIKRIREVKVDNEIKLYYNYYLRFENGKEAQIEPVYIDYKKIDDEEKKANVIKFNERNMLRLDEWSTVEKVKG